MLEYINETLLPPLVIIITLACWSFLYKENIVYRWVEYTLIASGIGTIVVINFESLNKIGISGITAGNYSLILPFILGALLYSRYWREYAWVQRYPLALITAVYTGLTVRGIIGMEIMNQIAATITLSIFDFKELMIILSVVFGIYYFMFSSRFTLPPKYNTPVKQIGRLVVMILFGFYLGNTIMSRLSYAIDRLQYIFQYLGII
jgi:hypothetical protein